METSVVKPSTFSGLGQALRWLRERQTRKQYQVADLAGITKGMLSAYETGRQRPSLETLDKLLDTLRCDLNDLHNAIQIVNGRPEAIRRLAPATGAMLSASGRPASAAPSEEPYPRGGTARSPGHPFPSPSPSDIAEVPAASELYRVLGHGARLPEPEERALIQMLDGFHQLIRYWDEALERLRRGRPPGPPGPAGAPPGVEPLEAPAL